MEHGVTMEHRVFRKNKQKNMPAVSLFSIFACTWFLLSSNSALYIQCWQLSKLLLETVKPIADFLLNNSLYLISDRVSVHRQQILSSHVADARHSLVAC